MPVKLTPKQEIFALAFLETGNASEAYRRAYDASRCKPESVHRLAFALVENVKVASRLAELRAIAAERAIVTVQSITRELEEARALAMTTKQPGGAVAASLGKAKLHGLLVEKVKSEGTVHLSVVTGVPQIGEQ